MKTIAPVYVGPWDPTWTAMTRSWLDTGARPDVVVMNPASGFGGGLDASWIRLLELLHTLGCVVIGYVATGTDGPTGRIYSSRSIEDLAAEAESWRRAGADGVFFDEIASFQALAYVQQLVAIVRKWRPRRSMPYTQNGQPCGLPVLNPGATVPAELIAGTWGAIWCTSEGAASPIPVGPVSQAPAARQAALVHSCPPWLLATTRSQLAASGFGWAYVTTDTLPNPWDGYTP